MMQVGEMLFAFVVHGKLRCWAVISAPAGACLGLNFLP